MGESKRNRRVHAAVLDGCPWCVYCGGDVPATTVDHVPSIIMFAQRQRPKGLAFGSCEATFIVPRTEGEPRSRQPAADLNVACVTLPFGSTSGPRWFNIGHAT
jgi:hypothetical protein